LDLERLVQRAPRETQAHPFNTRSWEVREAGQAHWNAPLPAPQAPPVPFAFLGQLIEEGRVTVFPTNGDRNWVVRVGDTIDGAYRVEAIADRTLTLTYLALETRQELTIGRAAGAHVSRRSTYYARAPVLRFRHNQTQTDA